MAPVPDDAELLRRFDPSNRDHVSVDQGTGKLRFRSGGLRWDPLETSEWGDLLGCSVYDHDVLRMNGLNANNCLDDPTWSTASVGALTVRTLVRENLPDAPSPFEALSDPVSTPAAKVHEVAHAQIVHSTRLKGSGKWYQRLAKSFAISLSSR